MTSQTAEPAGPIRRVIVGVDDSAPGRAALREAVTLARAHHARLVPVRAWALGLPRHGGRRWRHGEHQYVVLYFSGAQQRTAARALARAELRRAVGSGPAGLDLQILTPAGDPERTLTDLARRPGDVLVLGHRHGRSARSVVHGSVTSYCVRHARCPVIVVPPDPRVRRGPRREHRGHPQRRPAAA